MNHRLDRRWLTTRADRTVGYLPIRPKPYHRWREPTWSRHQPRRIASGKKALAPRMSAWACSRTLPRCSGSRFEVVAELVEACLSECVPGLGKNLRLLFVHVMLDRLLELAH